MNLGSTPSVPLHELVAEQARRTPDSTAVIGVADRLSYAELDHAANRLAHFLRATGTGVGSLVGVCLPRTPDLVIALLAVWRAGAAYVPLDPTHPDQRLAGIVTDTGARVVLTPEWFESVRAEVAEQPDTPPDTGVTSDDPAYVIYTSGSTGAPKGVVIPHAGIANRVMWTVRQHGLAAADRVLQKTTVSFDAAGWEVFAPLVSGGAVVLGPDGVDRDPALMLRTVAEQDVTVLQVVPSVLRMLVAEDWTGCGSLRLLFSAGEPLHAELCHRLLTQVDVEVWNTYGPTECSIDVTAHRFDPAQESGPVPIGRVLPGMRVLVLDAAGNPVPTGVPGELYAGGVGVALGYHRRASLTAERFVPDPYGPPGTRLYRTGDQVRWRADGTLEYLGRLDQQVKVNGVRVEPGEVEAALTAHPDVRGVAVVALDGRLVAYVVGDVSSDVLRKFLATRLPAALVPSVFVGLAALPLTASGKVDRKALPDPDLDRPAYVEPRTAAERAVAAAWSELLGVADVGVADDFFRLGGSSLLLTRLADRLGGVPLPALFTSVTVEAQARLLDQVPQGPGVVPVERDGTLPLSAGQHQMWLADRVHPGSPEWLAPLLVRLPGTLDVSTVNRALDDLVARHEILRTRYVAEDGEPRQVVDPPAPTVLRVVDGDLDLDEVLGEGFDLERGPVWRATLFRSPPVRHHGDGPVPDTPPHATDHLLVVTVHHIACDGWSSVVLERDIRALCAGRPLAPLPVQYADFAVWQRRYRTGEDQLEFWRQRLAGLTPLELPRDRPRAAHRDPAGAAATFTVPADLVDSLEALGRKQSATPYAVLLTALSVLLARYSGQWDVPVGTSVTGRTRRETDDVVGLFLNTLVMRCDLDPHLRFTEAVARVRDVTRSAFANQDLPFERVVNEVQPERDPSRTPLYQVMLNFHEDGVTGVANTALDLEVARRAWRVARTDLTVVLQRQADGALFGFLEYATALFDAATVERMSRHLVRLLESAAADPSTRLSELDLLTGDELAELSARHLRGAIARPETCVHNEFERRVATAPNRIAVVAGETQLDYAELDRRATHLAHRLRGLGVGPETVVGVLLGRSEHLLTAVLGIWKAGGAYVPLDTDAPPERLAHILADTAAPVVVTEPGRIVNGFTGHRVLVDEIPAGRAPRLPALTGPDNLAYVMYTSGSTGRPKGVQVEHRSLLNMLFAARDNLDFGAGASDAWLAMAAFTFDISCVELYLPLVTGGRVVVASEDEVLDYPARVRLLDRHAVTHLQVSPPGWELLLEAGFGTRDVVALTGGESTTPAHLRRIRSRVRKFFNEYGLTETTVAATRWAVPETAEVVAVGHAYPNVSTYLLDDEMRPVPPGAIGELYVGGAGVARGYLGQPGLTAARFVPDPFAGAGKRLYRTGDLCRALPDGALVFAGRADRQVKVRSRRVELGEIEATLAGHPGVRAAVVVAWAAGAEKRLVAYCVGTDGEPPALDELVGYARQHLPEFMLPGQVIPIERVPLNGNSKIDYAALPDPDRTRAEESEMSGAPRNKLEYRLVGLWAEVLDTFVGINDDFFQSGGSSILATRLISLVQAEFGVKIPLRALFEKPTVAELAVVVEEAVRAQVEAELAGIAP